MDTGNAAGRRFHRGRLGEFLPPPVFGLPVVVPGGIGIQYNSGNLRIGGFFPTGGATYGVVPINPYGVGPVIVGYPAYVTPAYGSINTRVTVQVNTPPVILVKRRSLPYIEEYDVTGIDLDAEHPSKIWAINRPSPRPP